MRRVAILYFLILAFLSAVEAQDTLAPTGFKQKMHNTFYREDYGKNIIRWDPTPAFIFEDARNFTIGYERVLPNNRSWSVNAGLLFMPMLLGDSIDKVSYGEDQFGFLVSADYRYYLTNLNKRPAPNGVYIGPYFSVYQNSGTTQFDYFDSSIVKRSATFERDFWMVNAGFQMGYQYVFWKRLALDVIFFGPSVTFYKVDMKLESGLSQQEEEDFYNSIPDKFTQNHPVLGSLIRDGEVNKQGSMSALTSGFRYCVQIGYVF